MGYGPDHVAGVARGPQPLQSCPVLLKDIKDKNLTMTIT